MTILQTLMDLTIIAWPILPANTFHGTDEEVNRITFKIAESKIEELNAISTTSALVTGVCATIYSWPIFDQAPWPAKTLFGTSFIFCLVSIRKALQQTYILRRLTLHGMTTPEMADKIRIQLANKNKDGHWVPCRIQQMIWNSSILFLNLALLTLVAGYVWTILAAAYRVRFDASKDDTRIAAAMITVGALSAAHYVGSGSIIYSRYMAPAEEQNGGNVAEPA